MDSTMVDTQVFIRWMIRRDMPETMRIENECFPQPWTEEDWLNCLRQRNNIAMVAEVAECVVGAMAYELTRTHLKVLNFAVRPDCQRRGIGTAMLGKLKGKLSPERRNRITLTVRESNLAAQKFFRSQGFKATGVERNAYSDFYGDEDGYQFEFRTACAGK